LDINSPPRRKVNKIDKPMPTVLIDHHDCPLTTKFAPNVADGAIGRVYAGTARSELREPFCLVE
jgi:hypothetical protein